MSTIREALDDARTRLQKTSASPAVDANILLCHILGCSRSHLMTWPEKELTAQQANAFRMVLERRLTGEPVAYITGNKEFWSLSLKVSQDVLIPRPETETLVEFVLELFAARINMRVADLGTGSGAIACALASEHPQWKIHATDIAAAALDVARANASTHQLKNIHFCQGCWFEPLSGQLFDLIVSNPPYVASNDQHLALGDLRFEPETALTSGTQGLEAIATLTQQAGAHLKPGGWLVVEHGYDQQRAVYERFESGGFAEIVQLSDLAALPRVTAGCYRD